MQFWSRPDCWNSGLIRFEQSEKPRLLNQNPAPSPKTLNSKLLANFICLPTVIYTPSYNRRFVSYDFWKMTRSLKFCSEQIKVFWDFCNPHSNSKVILGNFHFQHHSWLSRPSSGGYPCASIWLTIQKLRSFKVVGAARNFCWTKERKLIDFGLWS
jgi:hypothetical protein